MPVVPDRFRGKKEYLIAISELISAARYGGTTTYQEIARIAGLPLRGAYMGNEVGHLVGEISEDEVARERPMLSAVVVDVKGKIGPGFFTLAKELGKLTDDSEEGKRKFREQELKACHDTWRRTYKV